ncbi:MAG: ComF family protein [Legionellales bacterium]|nr:ComF family protein [Legionellales bacterium]
MLTSQYTSLWFSRLTAIKRRCVDWLFPQMCLVCHTLSHQSLPICQACTADLPWLHHYCQQCGYPLPDASDHHYCGHCLTHWQPDVRFYGLFSYQSPIRQLLYQLKFQQRLIVAQLLGTLFAKTLLQSYPQPSDYPQLILPIPLHPRRIRQRGYNQALEIAKPISHHLNIPLSYHDCHRRKHTHAQATLPAALRQQNIAHAFQIDPLSVDHVAVIDDIYTTGLTSLTFIQSLRRQGIRQIDLWIAARAL